MDQLHASINLISNVLNIFGTIIVLWGVLLTVFGFIRKELFRTKEAVHLNEKLRGILGSYLILGLEFFIASDIIRTVLTPTWQSLGMLGAIVAVRTVLSFFLTKDLGKGLRS